MAEQSSGETIPCWASIWTCAIDPAISCRHNRLSNGMEALISRITAAGPSAKRPPHMLLEFSVRSLMMLLPLLGLIACDRQSEGKGQDFPIGFEAGDRKSTRLNSSHDQISYAVFCL